jgi:TRAP-type mannitol/chloroaromatic compound transport system permease large subunit
MKSVAPKEIAIRQVWQAVTPYVVMGMLGLIAVMAFPGLATWLPKVLLSK